MRTPWRVIGSVLLAVLLIGVVASASEAASESITVETVRETVEWTLTPAQCSEIDVRIHGTGKRLQVITTTVDPDGSKEIINNDFVSGPAVDRKGGRYYFVYAAQIQELVPPDGAPVQVHVTDAFDLHGNNGDNNLNVSFVWHWTYSPPDEEFWPPVHDWRKEFTLGDPLHCDPI
jgi:hypothetical protein